MDSCNVTKCKISKFKKKGGGGGKETKRMFPQQGIELESPA